VRRVRTRAKFKVASRSSGRDRRTLRSLILPLPSIHRELGRRGSVKGTLSLQTTAAMYPVFSTRATADVLHCTRQALSTPSLISTWRIIGACLATLNPGWERRPHRRAWPKGMIAGATSLPITGRVAATLTGARPRQCRRRRLFRPSLFLIGHRGRTRAANSRGCRKLPVRERKVCGQNRIRDAPRHWKSWASRRAITVL